MKNPVFALTIILCALLLGSCHGTDIPNTDVQKNGETAPAPVGETREAFPEDTLPEKLQSDGAASKTPPDTAEGADFKSATYDEKLPAYQTSPSVPAEDEILELYGHTSRVWSQLTKSTLDCIYEEELEIDGYFPTQGIETKEEFRSYLRKYFSEAFTSSKLESFFNSLYKEIDGRLYVTPADGCNDHRAGDIEITVEYVDDTTVKLIKRVAVEEWCACGSETIRYPAGWSVQEHVLIYEDGKWVFDSFTTWDNLSDYDNGNGVYREYAEGIVHAYLQAYEAAKACDNSEYSDSWFFQDITSFDSNPDGSITLLLSISASAEDEWFYTVLTYIARQKDDGTWYIDGEFVLPDVAIQREIDISEAVNSYLDEIVSGHSEYADEREYINAHPEAFAAIVALGDSALPYLDGAAGGVQYENSADNCRKYAAMAAKYAIKPELYDLVYTSPDGRAQLKLSPLTFHTLWEPFTGITYTLSITDTESGASLLPENFVCEVSGDFEVFWSPDGRYAALSQGYRHLFTSLIIFDVRTSKLTDLSDRAAIQSALGQELLVLDSDTNNTYDRLHCYFESFCGDTVQYTVALQSAHGDEIQIGRLTADLASGYVTAFD